MLLLLPSDPLRPRRPDEHFAPEAAAARDLDIPVALVDHDALTSANGAAEGVARVPDSDDVVYRGWMPRSEQYAAMSDALAGRSTALRTPADAYRGAHELPSWYAALQSMRPKSSWTSLDMWQDFDGSRASGLPPASSPNPGTFHRTASRRRAYFYPGERGHSQGCGEVEKVERVTYGVPSPPPGPPYPAATPTPGPRQSGSGHALTVSLLVLMLLGCLLALIFIGLAAGFHTGGAKPEDRYELAMRAVILATVVAGIAVALMWPRRGMRRMRNVPLCLALVVQLLAVGYAWQRNLAAEHAASPAARLQKISEGPRSPEVLARYEAAAEALRAALDRDVTPGVQVAWQVSSREQFVCLDSSSPARSHQWLWTSQVAYSETQLAAARAAAEATLGRFDFTDVQQDGPGLPISAKDSNGGTITVDQTGTIGFSTGCLLPA